MECSNPLELKFSKAKEKAYINKSEEPVFTWIQLFLEDQRLM
jgi:hypothetical protein